MAAAMAPNLPIQGRGRPLIPTTSDHADNADPTGAGAGCPSPWPFADHPGPAMDRTPSYSDGPLGGMFGTLGQSAQPPWGGGPPGSLPMPRHYAAAGGSAAGLDQKQPVRIDLNRQPFGITTISEHQAAGVSSEDDLQSFGELSEPGRNPLLRESFSSVKVKNTFIDGFNDDECEEYDDGGRMGRAQTDGIGLGRYRPRATPPSDLPVRSWPAAPASLGHVGYPGPYFQDPREELLQQMAQSQLTGRWPHAPLGPASMQEMMGALGTGPAPDMHHPPPDVQSHHLAPPQRGDIGQATSMEGSRRYGSAPDAYRHPAASQYNGMVPPPQVPPPVAVNDVPPPPTHVAPTMLSDPIMSLPPGSPYPPSQHSVPHAAPQYQAMGLGMPMRGAPDVSDARRAPEATPEPTVEVVVTPLERRKPEHSDGAAQHGSGLCQPCAWFWKPQGCGNGQACRHCHMCPEGELKNRKKAKIANLRASGAAASANKSGQGRRAR